jgi:hypothetical protein
MSSALLFQPRVVASTVLLGTILQSRVVFVVLGAVMLWGALFPKLNLFDLVYNHTLGRHPGAPQLSPARAPRRFSQGMGATFAFAAACLTANLSVAAWVLEGLFLVAVGSLVFGRLCVGSFLYYLLGGRREFAVATLPWSRGVR